MNTKLQKRNDDGFTIIEVLIVLAIAGLILLVVLLAVPALNRSQRNTTIKNDVQSFLGGVSEYQGANDGALPVNNAAIDKSGKTVTYGASGTNQTTIDIQGSTAISAVSGTSVPTKDSMSLGTIYYSVGNKCSGDTSMTASPRSVAAFYLIETTNDKVMKCSST